MQAIGDLESLGLDVVLECAGVQDTLDQGVKLLKPGGALVIVGIHTNDFIGFSSDDLRCREITLYNVRRQNESTAKALRLIEEGRVKIDFMATHRFPLEQAQTAYHTVANYKDGVLKACIVM